MKQLNCIIIDDDLPSIKVLLHHAASVKQLNIVRYYTSPITALQELSGLDIDLVFLDIEMNPLNGIDFIGLLDPLIKVIYYTGHEQFAARSYDFGVVDYLLKPVCLKRFLQAIKKTESSLQLHPSSLKVDRQERYFIVYAQGKKQHLKIDFCDIDYMETVRNGCKIYFTNLPCIKIPYSVSKLCNYLPKTKFLRVNSGCIISLSRFHYYEKGFIHLTGRKDKRFPLGITFEDSFFEWINRYAP